MRVVLDTNVLLSGVFWKGPPATILDACLKGRFELVLSPAIIQEYRRAGEELARQFPTIDLAALLDSLVAMSRVVPDRMLPAQVCSDPDDDKFLAVAIASESAFVVSGDKALLRVRQHHGVRVVSARQFVQDQVPG